MAKESTDKSTKAKKNELLKVSTTIYEAIKKPPNTLEMAEDAFIKSEQFREGATLLGAIAVWQIAAKELYKPKFRTINAYLAESKTRLHASRSYIFEAIKIADAYMQYHEQLYAAGFREEKDASKLRIFYRAAEIHGREEAIKKLPGMNYREYRSWVNQEKSITDGQDKDGILENMEITFSGIRYGGKLLVSAKKIAGIIESGERPYVVGVRSDIEAREIGKFLKRKRQEWGEKK